MKAKAASHSADDGFVTDVMIVSNTRVATKVGEINHSVLRFYPENPRVYSIVREEGKDPTQESIQEKLEEMEHVRDLIHDIKKHGGLIDPLVVKAGSFEVVEGNSRLAAYRVLARSNPVKWAKVKCRLLPADINDAVIASLLGQWHLKGKKEWPPYEQAGYLYRRHHQQGVPPKMLATEFGLGAVRVEKIIEAYQLMIDNADTKRDRWSYYDEFVKSRRVAKVRESAPGFQDRVLNMVKHGEFERAADLRDKLPLICEGPPKVLQRFLTGKLDFDDAVEAARDGGVDNASYQKLKKFRKWLTQHGTEDDIVDAESAIREKIEFELRQLSRTIAALTKKL